MAQDTLGKKTHPQCVLFLFQNYKKIWKQNHSIDKREAIRTLQADSFFDQVFTRNHWPKDQRAIQAYINRFFRWLNLPPEEQRYYPTVILSSADSIALRQCLWLDFVFGTPEAKRALSGLREAIKSSPDNFFEVSPKTSLQFCEWVGVESDDTRRGPFARWLEQAGIAHAFPNRKQNETSVIVELKGIKQITPEAFVYGLYTEFSRALYWGSLRSVEITIDSVKTSCTVQALMLEDLAIPELIRISLEKGYISECESGIVINPQAFSRQLALSSPFPSLSWIQPESSIESPLEKSIVEELLQFSSDQCFATGGSPFEQQEVAMSSTQHRKRETYFATRVSDAYKNRCCISEFHFRSPNRKSWYGDAAHIVPHSGKAKDGTKVYGRADISNGIFLDKFYHWCFDKGWITLRPNFSSKTLSGYTIKVSSAIYDSFFENEASYLSNLDNSPIPIANLPNNRLFWPSVAALDWHHENVFCAA